MINDKKYYAVTDNVREYLRGAIIVKIYTAASQLLEGGLVIIFEKDWVVGIYIMGYTELGDWVELFEHKEELYYDTSNVDAINIVRVDNGFDKLQGDEDDW